MTRVCQGGVTCSHSEDCHSPSYPIPLLTKRVIPNFSSITPPKFLQDLAHGLYLPNTTNTAQLWTMRVRSSRESESVRFRRVWVRPGVHGWKHFLCYLFIFFLTLILWVWMVYLCTCLCGMYMPIVCRDQKALYHLELELQVVMSCHVDSGTKPESSGRAVSGLSCWAISPAHLADFKAESCYRLWGQDGSGHHLGPTFRNCNKCAACCSCGFPEQGCLGLRSLLLDPLPYLD